MNAAIKVFNSLSVRGRSRYTADFAAEVRSDFPNSLQNTALSAVMLQEYRYSVCGCLLLTVASECVATLPAGTGSRKLARYK
jgi:hypothetical protein